MTISTLKAAHELHSESDQLRALVKALREEKKTLLHEIKLMELNGLRIKNKGKVIDLEIERAQKRLKELEKKFRRL